jgi:murein DD-endopeptidase MepM/ murein hydrolase activator NlpD
LAALSLAGPACGTESPRDADATPSAPEATATESPADAERSAVWGTETLEWLRPRPRFDWPVERPHVTSRFGWRTDPVSGSGVQLHRGIDLRGDTGDYVLAVADGIVEFAGRDPLLGKMAIVDHGEGVRSIYGHMHDVLVHDGVPLRRGAAIGLIGNTGRSQAPHLHLTLTVDGEAVDPLAWLR